MSSTLKLPRFVAVLGTLVVGLLLQGPSASASDTFSLKNDSKVASLLGTSLWGKGNTMAAGCRTGPFPGPTLTPFTFNPGDRGSITLSQDPFSSCLPGINPLIDNTIQSPDLTNGTWVWIASDPVIGYASLTCSVLDQSGSRLLESSVDGLSCTISDGSNGDAGSFGSSAAPVRGGEAVAYVQHFAGSKRGSADGRVAKSAGTKGSGRGRYEVILRDRKGNVHGRMTTSIVSGPPRRVRVPISGALQKQVAKKDFVQVEASLKRVDGKGGTGDRATIAVMKDHSGLPF